MHFHNDLGKIRSIIIGRFGRKQRLGQVGCPSGCLGCRHRLSSQTPAFGIQRCVGKVLLQIDVRTIDVVQVDGANGKTCSQRYHGRPLAFAHVGEAKVADRVAAQTTRATAFGFVVPQFVDVKAEPSVGKERLGHDTLRVVFIVEPGQIYGAAIAVPGVLIQFDSPQMVADLQAAGRQKLQFVGIEASIERTISCNNRKGFKI